MGKSWITVRALALCLLFCCWGEVMYSDASVTPASSVEQSSGGLCFIFYSLFYVGSCRFIWGHIMVPWWHHDGTMMVPWWHRDGSMMIPWWHHDGYHDDTMMVAWWYHDGTRMVPWWYHDATMMVQEMSAKPLVRTYLLQTCYMSKESVWQPVSEPDRLISTNCPPGPLFGHIYCKPSTYGNRGSSHRHVRQASGSDISIANLLHVETVGSVGLAVCNYLYI